MLVAILLLTLSVNVCAEDSASSAYDRFVEELPRDVAEVLPKTLDGAGDSLVDAVSPSAIAPKSFTLKIFSIIIYLRKK